MNRLEKVVWSVLLIVLAIVALALSVAVYSRLFNNC